jgi:hypothetical protein
LLKLVSQSTIFSTDGGHSVLNALDGKGRTLLSLQTRVRIIRLNGSIRLKNEMKIEFKNRQLIEVTGKMLKLQIVKKSNSHDR